MTPEIKREAQNLMLQLTLDHLKKQEQELGEALMDLYELIFEGQFHILSHVNSVTDNLDCIITALEDHITKREQKGGTKC